MRTVHTHFPDGFVVASGPDDLARDYRDIHRLALSNPVSHTLSMALIRWPEVRQARRVERLDAIRRAVKAIGAPRRATEDSTAMLLGLSGAYASWRMHELYGLPLSRVPNRIVFTVELIVDDLRRKSVA